MAPFTITPNTLTQSASTLRCTFTSSSKPSPNDPISPATYLQFGLDLGNDMMIFPDDAIFTARDVEVIEDNSDMEGQEEQGGERMLAVSVGMGDLPKVSKGNGEAEVALYAWKGEKMLGKWVVGKVNGLRK